MVDKMPLLFQKEKTPKRKGSSDHKRRGHWVNLTVDSMERLNWQTFLESTTLKGAIIMTKINVWELVNKEAANIIKAIEKGEIKTRIEFHDYLETVYNWKMSNAIVSIVGVYISVNNIEMVWDYELEEPAE